MNINVFQLRLQSTGLGKLLVQVGCHLKECVEVVDSDIPFGKRFARAMGCHGNDLERGQLIKRVVDLKLGDEQDILDLLGKLGGSNALFMSLKALDLDRLHGRMALVGHFQHTTNGKK